MCHCAPVFRIHKTASRTRRVGIGLRPGRLSGTFSSGKCSRIRSHWSSRSFNTYTSLRHYIDVRNDFEIGSSRAPGTAQRLAASTAAPLSAGPRCEAVTEHPLLQDPVSFSVRSHAAGTVTMIKSVDLLD